MREHDDLDEALPAAEMADAVLSDAMVQKASAWALRFYAALAANGRLVQQALLANLRPTLPDLQQVFVDGYAEQALHAYDVLWERHPAFPIPRPQGVRVEIFSGAQLAQAASLRALREVAAAVRPSSVWGQVLAPDTVPLDGLVFLPKRVIWLPRAELFLFGRPSPGHTQALAHFCD